MTLAIHDDGKGNCQSWEVGLMEENDPFIGKVSKVRKSEDLSNNAKRRCNLSSSI